MQVIETQPINRNLKTVKLQLKHMYQREAIRESGCQKMSRDTQSVRDTKRIREAQRQRDTERFRKT